MGDSPGVGAGAVVCSEPIPVRVGRHRPPGRRVPVRGPVGQTSGSAGEARPGPAAGLGDPSLDGHDATSTGPDGCTGGQPRRRSKSIASVERGGGGGSSRRRWSSRNCRAWAAVVTTPRRVGGPRRRGGRHGRRGHAGAHGGRSGRLGPASPDPRQPGRLLARRTPRSPSRCGVARGGLQQCGGPARCWLLATSTRATTSGRSSCWTLTRVGFDAPCTLGVDRLSVRLVLHCTPFTRWLRVGLVSVLGPTCLLDFDPSLRPTPGLAETGATPHVSARRRGQGGCGPKMVRQLK